MSDDNQVVPSFEPAPEDQVPTALSEDASDLEKAVFLKVMAMEIDELLQYVLGWELRYYTLDAPADEQQALLNEQGFGNG